MFLSNFAYMDTVKKYIYIVVAFITMLICASCNPSKEKTSSIKFKHYTFDTICPLVNSQSNPALKFSIDVEYPDSYNDTNVLSLLQSTILSTITNDLDTRIDSNIVNFANKCIADYMTLQAEFIAIADSSKNNKTITDSYKWDYKANIKQVYCKKNLLTTETSIYSDKGGAHGSLTQNYVTFDLELKKQLTCEDLFSSDCRNQLSEMIISKLLEANKLQDDEDLENIGYFDIEEIKPTDNFLIGDDGITFVYNGGEIAAYALGIIKVSIPYKELQFALKADSPFINYIQ